MIGEPLNVQNCPKRPLVTTFDANADAAAAAAAAADDDDDDDERTAENIPQVH